MRRRIDPRWLSVFAIVALSIAFRLPPLLNARGTNSDAAIVGLQAIHILRGEFSWLLFGSHYQTSCDAIVAALVFAVTGPSAVALMASTLGEHILATLVAWDVLRKRTSLASAFILVLPLIFTGAPVHTYVLYPPRQLSITLVFVAVWVLDGARSGVRPILRYAAGTAVLALACFADPYAVLFAPAVLFFALLACFDGAPMNRLDRNRVFAVVGGGVLGAIPFVLLSRVPGAAHGTMTLTSAVIAHNARLFWDACLPWALSYRVYAAPNYDAWDAPRAIAFLQSVGAMAIALLVLLAFVIACARRAMTWELRRVGVLGFLTIPLTVFGFLVSVMVMDIYSSRYLVAMLLFLPFALAPLASIARARTIALLLGPYVVASAIAGWVAYGPSARGVVPVAHAFEDEARVADYLNAKEVKYATADYWASYRLTFLSAESIIVVPKNRAEDRYLPYRTAFANAPVAAYIFDRERSREAPSSVDANVRELGIEIDRTVIGSFTVVIFRRAS